MATAVRSARTTRTRGTKELARIPHKLIGQLDPLKRPRPQRTTLQVCVLLDKSGSMGVVRDQTIAGFNEYVDALRRQRNAVRLSLTAFDTAVEVRHTAATLRSIPRLDSVNYVPSGGTALFDAVAATLEALDGRLGSGHTDPVLVVILTDGEENSSQRASAERVRQLIEERTARGNWTFTYIGANQDAWRAAGALGILAGNIAGFQADNAGTTRAFARLASATEHRLHAAMAMNVASTGSFFEDAGVPQFDDASAGVFTPSAAAPLRRLDPRTPGVADHTSLRWARPARSPKGTR